MAKIAWRVTLYYMADFNPEILTPEKKASLILAEHSQLPSKQLNPKNNQLLKQIASKGTLGDLGQLDTFPSTHFGNEFTKIGRELKRVDNFYDSVVKKIMSDPDATSSIGEPRFNHKNSQGIYRTILDVGSQRMSFSFEEKGPTPNLLRISYQKVHQPDVSDDYYFEINPNGIRMSNSSTTTEKGPKWEHNLDLNAIDKGELTNRDRYALHIFEKAAKLYLDLDQNQ